MLPKISVVTPAFRSVNTIEKTIQSVLEQRYPNLEYIVIDGGSEDGTIELLKCYSERIHYWISEPDNGHYHAIIKGFEKATGDIFYWINSDDMMLPGSLQAAAEIFMQFPEIEWLSSIRPAVWDEQGALHRVFNIPGFSRASFLWGRNLPAPWRHGSTLQQESTLFSAALWRKTHHVLREYPLAGDFALWCEMLKYAELTACAQPLGGFRLRAGQRSEDYTAYLLEADPALQELRRHFGWKWWHSPIRMALQVTRSRKIQGFAAKFLRTRVSYVYNARPRGERNWVRGRRWVAL